MQEQQMQRAILLLQQQKYQEAEKILGALFAEFPDDPQVMGLLCEAKIAGKKFDEALELANSAIGLDPSYAMLFYSRSRIYLYKDKYDEAEADLHQAISLDPGDSDYYAFLALIKIERKKFEEGLQLAEEALEINPENLNALNARSTALMKLNRNQESIDTIEGALREDPNNAYTHANYGWGLLEKGSPKKALHHFSEALKQNPNLAHARYGMAEALKARYAFYRLFLKFSFWMGNLQQKYQWGVILGFYFLVRSLRIWAEKNPAVEPYVVPIIVLLSVFAFFTWIMGPLGNLFLRLNKFGKHLLDREDLIVSNLIGISLAVAVFGGVTYLISGNESWLSLALVGFTLMIPLGMIFSSKKKKMLMRSIVGLLTLLGIIAVFISFRQENFWHEFLIVYLLGIFAFQWIANFILVREQNK